MSKPSSHPLDAHYTHPLDALVLTEHHLSLVGEVPEGECAEYFLGGGAFAAAMDQVLQRPILGVDIDPECPGRELVQKFLVADARYVVNNVAFSATNPPFSNFALFIQPLFRNLVEGGSLSFLLPSGAPAGRKRYELYTKDCPPAFITHLCGRPSFRPDGSTDKVEYVQMV